MHTHQSLWKGGEPLFFDETGYAGLSDLGPVVHRRPAAPRPGDPGLRRPDDELVQAARARLRGAGQPRVQPAQPLGVVPHPAGPAQPEGQARRVPLPRRLVEPVPGLLGDDDGRPRRRAEQDRAARPGRQGPLRPPARGAGAGAAGARLARRRAGRAGRATTPSSRPAACSPTTSSRRTSTTRRRTRSTRSACARTRTSSSSTTTSDPGRSLTCRDAETAGDQRKTTTRRFSWVPPVSRCRVRSVCHPRPGLRPRSMTRQRPGRRSSAITDSQAAAAIAVRTSGLFVGSRIRLAVSETAGTPITTGVKRRGQSAPGGALDSSSAPARLSWRVNDEGPHAAHEARRGDVRGHRDEGDGELYPPPR